jgi:hypothetical protein
MADLKRYRKQFRSSDGHIDEAALTPSQRANIGSILWAEMQAYPEQLQRVLQEHPDMTLVDIKSACGVTDEEPEHITQGRGDQPDIIEVQRGDAS